MLKKIAIGYGMFVLYQVVTAMVVRPAVKSAGIPLLKDVL